MRRSSRRGIRNYRRGPVASGRVRRDPRPVVRVGGGRKVQIWVELTPEDVDKIVRARAVWNWEAMELVRAMNRRGWWG